MGRGGVGGGQGRERDGERKGNGKRERVGMVKEEERKKG